MEEVLVLGKLTNPFFLHIIGKTKVSLFYSRWFNDLISSGVEIFDGLFIIILDYNSYFLPFEYIDEAYTTIILMKLDRGAYHRLDLWTCEVGYTWASS